MSEDSKKKSKMRRAQPLDGDQGPRPSKGAVPLAREPIQEPDFALGASETVEIDGGFLSEETDPEAQSMTIESVNLKTDVEANTKPQAEEVRLPAAKKIEELPQNKKSGNKRKPDAQVSAVLKPQSQIKKPPSARQSKHKRDRADGKPPSPKLDLDAINELPSARFTKSKSYSSKRKKADRQPEKAAPRFKGNTQDFDPSSVSFSKNKVPSQIKPVEPSKPPSAPVPSVSSSKRAKKTPAPPSKEKLSHATQIFVQDALAAVDLLDENIPQAPASTPAPKATPPQNDTKSKVPVRSEPTQVPLTPAVPKTPVADPSKKKVVEPTQANVNVLNGRDVTKPGGDAIEAKGKAERIQREFGRALDAPQARRAQEREGKVLNDEPDRYQQDGRPLAYRGAWWVGQPDIRPKRLPKMMRGVLKRTRGEKRFLWAALVASFMGGLLFVGPEFFHPSAQAKAWQDGLKIEMSSSPSGAKVYLAGTFLGETPLALRKELPLGEHELRFEYGELIPIVEKISITAQQKSLNLHFPLVAFSKLELSSEPKGAVVFMGEEELGKTPLSLAKLPLDQEVPLELRQEGYKNARVILPKVRPMSETRHVHLYRKTGTGKVTLQSTKELLVYKGETRIGVTGPAPIELSTGDHLLELVEPITGQKNNYFVRVVSKATRRYYFDWSDSP